MDMNLQNICPAGFCYWVTSLLVIIWDMLQSNSLLQLVIYQTPLLGGSLGMSFVVMGHHLEIAVIEELCLL